MQRADSEETKRVKARIPGPPSDANGMRTPGRVPGRVDQVRGQRERNVR